MSTFSSQITIDDYIPAPEKRVLFFDLETQKSAAEVGGWGNTHLMRLAVGVIYDSIEKKYIRYFEDEAYALVDKLLSADLVVGFNHIQFDYGVLRGYTSVDLAKKTKSFDILVDVHKRLGKRISLNNIAGPTLNTSKTADGLQSLIWWAEGKHDLVADYCESDVKITKDVFEYGVLNKWLLYKLKNGEPAKLPLDWNLEGIIKTAAKNANPLNTK